MKIISGIFLLLLPIVSLFGQENWVLKKDKQGVKVYNRKIEGSQMKAFRAEAEINATVETIVAVFKDPENYGDWIPDTKDPELLETKGETHQWHYLITKAPWPVSNRDATYQYIYTFLPENKSVEVRVTCLPEYVPEKSGNVRMLKADGKWTLTPNEKGTTDLVFEMHADPGGALPAWLVNSAAIDNPFQTFLGLKEQVKKEKYHNASYAFMKP